VGEEQRERAQSVLRLGSSGHPDRGRLGIRVGIWFVQNRQGRQRVGSVWQAAEGHEKAGRRNLEVRKSHGPARPIGFCCCVEASLSVAINAGCGQLPHYFGKGLKRVGNHLGTLYSSGAHSAPGDLTSTHMNQCPDTVSLLYPESSGNCTA